MLRSVDWEALARFLIAPLLVFIALMIDQSYLVDLWHHLARGKAIVEQGQLVNRDIFTFTVPGREFQDVNWLSQVIYFHLHELGGLDLVRLVNALILSAAMAVLVALCRRESGSLAAASAAGMLAFLGLWQVLTIRPQSFSILLFVLMLDALQRAQRRPGWLLVPPVLMALWANLHGAFPAGLILIGCSLLAALGRAVRVNFMSRTQQAAQSTPADRGGAGISHLAACLAGGVICTLVNPYGWRVYAYVASTSNLAATRQIDEWIPPTLDLWITWAWLGSLCLLAGATCAAWRRGVKPSLRELILIGCFLPLACGSVRMLAWWFLVTAPMIARLMAGASVGLAADGAEPEEAVPSPSLGQAVGAGLMCGVMSLAALSCVPQWQHLNPLLPPRVVRTEDDLDAVRAWLSEVLPAGRVFSRYEWGEYLSWAFYPDYRIFMDARIEIYPDETWNDYTELTCGLPGWEQTLDRHRVDVLILDASYHAQTGLLPRLQASPAWHRAFQIGDAVVFLRPEPQPTQRR